MNRRQFLLSLPFFAFGLRASACLWDTDTVAMEANGNEDAMRVITGRFDRFPPKYYEMRLARVTAEISASPQKLALYDDAGVACDRLGRSDESISWMEKKKAILDAAPESPEKATHTYRYLANLGTFCAHRWLKNGADNAKLDEIEKAVGLIRAAIGINVDAHFGREVYQQIFLEWLLKVRRGEKVLEREVRAGREEFKLGISFLGLAPASVEWQRNKSAAQRLTELGLPNASRGVGGLVELGSAWESVDVFYALCVVHTWYAENSIGALAGMRLREILAASKSSLDPATLLHSSKGPNPGLQNLDTEHWKSTERFFIAARKEADAWQKARHSYAEARFAKGEHPDTHPGFWKTWKEPSQPPAFPGKRRSTGK